MDVREDRAIGIYDFGVSGHAHVRLGIADGFAVGRFEAKTQPDEMIGGEWRGAAFPNHFVAIWQSRRHAVRRDSCLFAVTARAAYADSDPHRCSLSRHRLKAAGMQLRNCRR